MQNQFYVYVCYVNQKPVYVGKGKNLRYKHCTSGKSHNTKLNNALIEYGYEAFKILFPFKDLTEKDALILEKKLIRYYLDKGYDIFNNDTATMWYREFEIPMQLGC